MLNSSNGNVNNIQDGIFAQLTEMFGDIMPPETILKVGREQKWNLEECIEKLIKINSEKLKSSTNMNRKSVSDIPLPNAPYPYERSSNVNTLTDEDDADILIESEEILTSTKPLPNETAANVKYTGAIKKTPSTMSTSNRMTPKSTFPSLNPDENVQTTKNDSNQISFSSFLKNFTNQFADDVTQSPINKHPRMQSIAEHPELDEIVRIIEQGCRIMIILRGVPGSGKSYLGRTIINRTMNGDYENHIFSADDFFYNRKTNQYVFNRDLIGQAHEDNKKRVKWRATNGWSPIIVDNTNVKLWEMFPYIQTGVQNGYIIKIIEPNTPWARSAGKLYKNNKHDVPKETIQRMLRDFERANVNDLLRILKLNYSCPLPQRRNHPKIGNTQNFNKQVSNTTGAKIPTTIEHTKVTAVSNNTGRVHSNNKDTFGNDPKPPRNQRRQKVVLNSENAVTARAIDESGPFQMATKTLERFEDEWEPFEENTQSFWNKNEQSISRQENAPKPQRALQTSTSATNFDHIYNLLKDDKKNSTPKSNEEPTKVLLKKHEKGCTNENESFQQIRQIYPNIPVSLLWDLFEKCNGNGDWTMDILLNEGAIDSFEKLETEEAIQRDNFICNCRSPSVSLELQQAVNAIPVQLLQADKFPPILQQSERTRKELSDRSCDNDIRKRIEEQFVISDEHYSDHTRKIRDFRRGITTNSTQIPMETDQQSAQVLNDDNSPESEEMIQIDLGFELVCQLDSSFGTDMFKKDVLKDIKTTVFMPKSLGQQLYAIWVESLYNQIEEQRQKSVKDDEEFAKELYIKEKYPQLLQDKPPDNIKDIMEMEIAWKAYKADINEWKKSTPQDLASKLSRTKLYEIFPNIDKSTLVEVLAAHDHKFAKTVEVLNTTLQSNVGSGLEVEGQRLLNQAQLETQNTNTKEKASAVEKTTSAKKLNPEDAKRAALIDFEENRNMAMHHSHLKAECYVKARDAFRRRTHSVAVYYSNVANLHKNKVDMYNMRAANCIIEAHSYTQQNPDMLDLHYLHSAEAIECLDIFLDQQINQLKAARRGIKFVFVITGRGLHSAGGFSTIKHRVKGRLRERNLSWIELNPGLLKVKLQFISVFTQNL